ncbi:MAG TPA: 2-phospho-L-lactate guanylyltransferase [Actinomycetota bacterium]|jgi:2-phospho-L-lactate guanylyltransferase|nr:2-phospho-L-lactate guanylyltransferase [Actinomycetota bacterium]
MRVIAVPVKSLERAKGRLSGVLSPLERAALTLAMLEDVLDSCLAQPGWHTWVISPDEAVLEVSARRRARPVVEDQPGLLAAVHQIEQTAAGADALAVVLGDLPLLSSDALGRLLQTIGPVVAAPSASDGGTNVLLRRPPDVIQARFGTRSFRKHRDAAEFRGIPFAQVAAPELAYDLDRPQDVPEVLARGGRRRTRAICLEMGLAERLTVLAESGS